MKNISPIDQNYNVPFFLQLCAIGGFLDASSFLLFKTFTTHLTGNSILSMIYLAQMNLKMFFLSAISIIGFICGSGIGILINIKKLSLFSSTHVLILEFLLICCFFIAELTMASLYLTHFSLFILSLSMGIQNGYFNKIGSISTHSTFITGMTTSCLSAFIKNKEGDNSGKVLFLSLLSFILGGLLGALLTIHYQLLGTSFVLLLLFIAIFYSRKSTI